MYQEEILNCGCIQLIHFKGVCHINAPNDTNMVRNIDQRGYVRCPLHLRLNSVPDSCSESRMLRMEAILSAVAGLTVSWSSIFSKEPSSFTSRSITTENHKKYKIAHYYVCRLTIK